MPTFRIPLLDFQGPDDTIDLADSFCIAPGERYNYRSASVSASATHWLMYDGPELPANPDEASRSSLRWVKDAATKSVALLRLFRPGAVWTSGFSYNGRPLRDLNPHYRLRANHGGI